MITQSTFTFLIVALFIIFIINLVMFKEDKEWWNSWDDNPYNFPFKYKGRTLWMSRSVATASFIFGLDDKGKLHVLANKRGSGAADFQGLWNCPCGYLDYNETLEEAAAREIYEETGIAISKNLLILHKVESNPSSNRQNVTARFYCLIRNESIDSTFLSNFNLENMEENEVSEVKWIPIDEIDNESKYQWAFNHNEIIKEIAEQFK